jgi:hypothetical protein
MCAAEAGDIVRTPPPRRFARRRDAETSDLERERRLRFLMVAELVNAL